MSSIPHLLLKASQYYYTTMSSWRSDPFGVPEWHERPKCHCGFRTMLGVWTDRVQRAKYGRRFFKCPDLDDDFVVTTTTKSFVSRYRSSTLSMTSTTTHIGLQVHRMGGSGAAGMATEPSRGGKQRTIPCQDGSGSRGGTTNAA